MFVETTSYFAKPGNADAVLEQRRKATAIRRELGLDPGRIFVRLEGNGPDVRWECAFPSREDYERDMAVRAGSNDFADARKAMHELIERFERHVYRSVAD